MYFIGIHICALYMYLWLFYVYRRACISRGENKCGKMVNASGHSQWGICGMTIVLSWQLFYTFGTFENKTRQGEGDVPLTLMEKWVSKCQICIFWSSPSLLPPNLCILVTPYVLYNFYIFAIVFRGSNSLFFCLQRYFVSPSENSQIYLEPTVVTLVGNHTAVWHRWEGTERVRTWNKTPEFGYDPNTHPNTEQVTELCASVSLDACCTSQCVKLVKFIIHNGLIRVTEVLTSNEY